MSEYVDGACALRMTAEELAARTAFLKNLKDEPVVPTWPRTWAWICVGATAVVSVALIAGFIFSFSTLFFVFGFLACAVLFVLAAGFFVRQGQENVYACSVRYVHGSGWVKDGSALFFLEERVHGYFAPEVYPHAAPEIQGSAVVAGYLSWGCSSFEVQAVLPRWVKPTAGVLDAIEERFQEKKPALVAVLRPWRSDRPVLEKLAETGRCSGILDYASSLFSPKEQAALDLFSDHFVQEVFEVDGQTFTVERVCFHQVV